MNFKWVYSLPSYLRFGHYLILPWLAYSITISVARGINGFYWTIFSGWIIVALFYNFRLAEFLPTNKNESKKSLNQWMSFLSILIITFRDELAWKRIVLEGFILEVCSVGLIISGFALLKIKKDWRRITGNLFWAIFGIILLIVVPSFFVLKIFYSAWQFNFAKFDSLAYLSISLALGLKVVYYITKNKELEDSLSNIVDEEKAIIFIAVIPLLWIIGGSIATMMLS